MHINFKGVLNVHALIKKLPDSRHAVGQWHFLPCHLR